MSFVNVVVKARLGWALRRNESRARFQQRAEPEHRPLTGRAVNAGPEGRRGDAAEDGDVCSAAFSMTGPGQEPGAHSRKPPDAP